MIFGSELYQRSGFHFQMDFKNVLSKRCHDYRFADKNPRILGILEKTSCFLIAKTSNIYIYILLVICF